MRQFHLIYITKYCANRHKHRLTLFSDLRRILEIQNNTIYKHFHVYSLEASDLYEGKRPKQCNHIARVLLKCRCAKYFNIVFRLIC